jgi:aminopeptidase N
MKKICIIALVSAAAFSACKSTKNTVTFSGTEAKKNPEPEIYMASYTRVSDIIHTRLDVSFNWDSCFVYGKAVIKAKPYFHSSDQLILDAKGFKINKISMSGKDLKYDYDNSKLKIYLGKTYTRNESYTIAIDYIAMPNRLKVGGSAAITSDKGLYFINPQGKEKYKPRQLWTQGETEASSCWFPTIENTGEKMTQEISITVEKAMKTLSNGALVYSTENSDGTRTDTWKQDVPHSPYLTMIAAGNFDVVKDKWRGMEVSYYMEPEYAKYARLIFGKTPEMIEFFSKKTGVDYPWDKYSQIVVRDFVSGAMENTSAVTFYDAMNMTDREYLDQPNEDIVSHELFHHWFGDMVTCESWPNIPLNEGFATYGQYLWDEYKYGREVADRGAQNDLNLYLASSNNQVDLVRFKLEDREEMFDANSYQKGGRIIHMLRKYLGDDAFFAGIKLYLETNKFKSVEIHQLRLAFEEVSGEDLNWFFNQWFLASGHAILTIDYSYDEAGKAKVTIRQQQNFDKTPLYKLPLDVDIYENGKLRRERITMTKVEETFEFTVSSKPDLINVDAEKMLVGVKKDNHTKEEWIYMYNHAPLYMDRYEALDGMDKWKEDEQVQQTIIKALGDRSRSIRAQAISKAKNLSADNKEKIYNTMLTLAEKDPKSSVRYRAVAFISTQYESKDNMDLFRRATTDSAYSVVSAALKAITKKDKQEAMKIAKQYESDKSSFMVAAIAELYAENGTAAENPYFLDFFERSSGLTPIYVLPLYKMYLKRMDDETIKKGVDVMKVMVESTTVSFVESSAKSVIAEGLANADKEETKTYIKEVMNQLDKKKQ